MTHRFVALLLLAPFAASAETYYMYVLNEPEPGREAEYNDWYSNRQAPDVVSIPGFVSAQRSALSATWRVSTSCGPMPNRRSGT